MAAQIITDCGNFTLDFKQHGFCAHKGHFCYLFLNFFYYTHIESSNQQNFLCVLRAQNIFSVLSVRKSVSARFGPRNRWGFLIGYFWLHQLQFVCDLLSCGPHSLTAANDFSKAMSLNNDKTLENVTDFVFYFPYKSRGSKKGKHSFSI